MTYSYEDAWQNSLQYFNGDELAAKVVVDKYLLRNNKMELLENSPVQMHRRIAREFARVEKNKFKKPLTEDEIFALLDQFKYIIPQGSPMFGIGNPHQTISLSNCFLVESPVDSYSGILKSDEQLVQISKRRGGVGIDISNLRPVGTITQNAARTSTGIIPFMERYSNSIREVGQSGRRGALLISLSVHHPQILDFIKVKRDLTKIVGANLSIRLTDEFMKAVQHDKEFELRWPVDSNKPTISQKIKAKEIWHEIVKSAHLSAEPGLLFWDTIMTETPTNSYEEYKCQGTNPCQPSWAKLLTPNGIRLLADVSIGDKIWSEDGWVQVIAKHKTGVKKVFKYETSAGVFYGTENHRLLSRGNKISAKDCKEIDILSGPETDVILNHQDVMDGLVIGDGMIHKASNNLILLCIGAKDSDYFNSEISYLIGKKRDGISKYAWEIKTTIQYNELPRIYKRQIPQRFMGGDKNKVCGFLRGLFTANGSIVGNRVTLKLASSIMREQVQMMLSSVGITSYYTTNAPTSIAFTNGTYLCKESYDINISRDRNKFLKLIGFIQVYKQEKLRQIILKVGKSKYATRTANKTFKIKKTEYIGEEEVYDITVDGQHHTYWTQGLNVSNCSELVLCPLDSCRLLLLNLYSYVKNPFTTQAIFDFDLFGQHCQIAQRLMDDLVDLESECIRKIIKKINDDPEGTDIKSRELTMWKEILRKCTEGRRTGTGLTGLGDVLAALGLAYDSTAAVKKAEKIYRALKLNAYRSSVDMAKELGAFACWDHKLESNHPFLLRIKDEDPQLYSDMAKYGRRNIALLTTAPAGSVSLLTRTTSGIEPCFKLSYVRRRKITHSEKDAKVDFIDNSGDKWQEYTVMHPKLQEWMKITGENDIKKSPWHGSCAEDIAWMSRIKLQAACQKHVCHSISSTINLPENISIDKVSEIYHTAWEAGCKGITIYRNNCRTGVLVEKSNGIVHTTAPKRPKSLPCDIHHVNVIKMGKNHEYMVIVGLLGNDPYEIFALENGHVDKTCTKGKIVKIGRGHYQLEFSDGTILKNITKDTSGSEDALTRVLSCGLRHGSDVQFIVSQLEKTQDELFCFAKAISRTLKKYIKDGTKICGEECPECKAALVRQDGCIKCFSCGYSKCT